MSLFTGPAEFAAEVSCLKKNPISALDSFVGVKNKTTEIIKFVTGVDGNKYADMGDNCHPDGAQVSQVPGNYKGRNRKKCIYQKPAVS